MVKHWNKLPREVVKAPGLPVFKKCTQIWGLTFLVALYGNCICRLDDPHGSLPSQPILWFYGPKYLLHVTENRKQCHFSLKNGIFLYNPKSLPLLHFHISLYSWYIFKYHFCNLNFKRVFKNCLSCHLKRGKSRNDSPDAGQGVRVTARHPVLLTLGNSSTNWHSLLNVECSTHPILSLLRDY